MQSSCNGVSDPDGTWNENQSNAFNSLISLAKGQRDIVQAGEACLYERSKEVEDGDSASTEVQELVSEMLRIVRGRRVGLAAPQLGGTKRIWVMEAAEEGVTEESEDGGDREKR